MENIVAILVLGGILLLRYVARSLSVGKSNEKGPVLGDEFPTIEVLQPGETVIVDKVEPVRYALAAKAAALLHGAGEQRRKDLQRMIDALGKIKNDRPETFFEALQLFWLYALLAGVINYGRMDDVLGPFLQKDLDEGRIDEAEAFRLLNAGEETYRLILVCRKAVRTLFRAARFYWLRL